MLMQQTFAKLRDLRLNGMAMALEEQLSNTAILSLSFEERLSMLVEHEVAYRDNKRLKRLLKDAKLRYNACIEDIDYRHNRGLDKPQMASLVTCEWVSRGQNLILTGPTGCGKTWLACAFGHQSCRHGKTVSFHKLSRLLEDLHFSHADGTFNRRLMQLDKIDLLILDDFGSSTITTQGRSDLLELIDNRTGSKSTIVTSQIPIEDWYDYLNISGENKTVADAILDRVISDSFRIALMGESARRHRK